MGDPDTEWPGDAPIKVVAYDNSWPGRFAAERDRLEPLLAPWLTDPIEHVGSTAVPGLPAKPVIDIMAPVASLPAARPAIEVVTAAGYVHYPYKADLMHWFCRPSPALRTHHLHLIPRASTLWQDRLAFRNALRNNPELAREYTRLKSDLAARFRHDREAYTEGKTRFVQRVLAAYSYHKIVSKE